MSGHEKRVRFKERLETVSGVQERVDRGGVADVHRRRSILAFPGDRRHRAPSRRCSYGRRHVQQNVGLNLAYHFNDNLALRAQANNLTNQPLRLTQNNDDLDVRRFDAYGRSYLVDLTFKLR